GGSADVDFLPMMQRRRLSPLARGACAVAWHARRAGGDMPVVYFSRHGESRYYFEMLQGMAAGEAVSPSRFSLCVHNAVAGLFSIQSQSHLPYVCLAGGTEELFAAFVEAGGQLLEVPQVMVVCYEQPLPEVYGRYVSSSPMTWALAMVLGREEASGLRLHLARNRAVDCNGGSSTLIHAIADGLLEGYTALERSLWRWSLQHV
ncbi:MAG: beta-ketoacyl synthase chain length factor, partial [Methylomonas sp.]|nr:beta-ketoacyl synthase chain length factor [Methylomonas sp.]